MKTVATFILAFALLVGIAAAIAEALRYCPGIEIEKF
jgi:hypothetical protein